jgi:hypothetical protein
MTMPAAALSILQADDTLRGGANYNLIYSIFAARGLLGELNDDVTNSHALVGRSGDVLVTLSALTDEADLQLFDVSGRLLWSQQDVKKKLTAIPNEVMASSGVYFVRITIDKQRIVRKVLLIER